MLEKLESLELSSKGDFDKPTLIPNIKEPTNKNDLIFISYSREDSQYANRLYNDLQNASLNPWLDKKELLPG